MNLIKNTNRKAKIYLADLVHNYIGRGPFMFPINIGYMKAYIKKIHGDNLENYHNESAIKYRFYLPQDQVAALKNYINQFKNVNPLFTLRKMSEYIGVSDLFYMVESKDIKDYRMQSERHEFHTSKLAQ